MKQTLINYFISENYISDWTVQDALRELYQNFIDYGEYEIEHSQDLIALEQVSFSNNFSPNNIDFLIIGDSNKDDKSRGKYGEGLKMAALVILRNGGNLSIFTSNFRAIFELITNTNTGIRTLGVLIEERESPSDRFYVDIKIPIGEFHKYQDKLIKPIDVLHTTEGYGSIVNKPKGSLFVGGLFVCVLNDLNYAYDILPKHIQLDRDRKVPQNFEVKWAISKIQETYTEFDPTGKSQDVVYSQIPETYIPRYTPKIKGDQVVFTTKVINEHLKEVEVEVSNSFNQQLSNQTFFSKMVFKLKQFITSNLNIDQMAIKFRKDYCHTSQAETEFDILMLRLGIDIKKLLKDSNIEEDEAPF